MSVKFTQYMLPNGRKKIVAINLEPDIEKIAHELQNEGVNFDIEVLMMGMVSMTAWVDEENPLAHELCPHGPKIVDTVKALIINARNVKET